MKTYERIQILILHILIFVLCSACVTDKDTRYLNEALELAGDNRAELEKVLSHYSENPEKYEAACWLIANMPMHHTKMGPELTKYRRYFEEAADQTRNPKSIADSLDALYGKPNLSGLDAVYDVETLDSAFIVSNIDMAFEAREKRPWGKNVRWEDFLEFVLPYRLGDEPLSDWRKEILKEYGSLIDSIASLPEASSPRFASDLLFKEWIWRKNYKWTSKLPSGPRIGSSIVEWKTGGCREKADGMIYLLRAAGLPAAFHVAPMRGDLNDSHSWGVIIDSDGSPWLPEQHTDSAYKSIVPAAKVQCETYSINRKAPILSADCSKANPALCNPFMRDETSWYLAPDKRRHFKLPIDRLPGVENRDTVYIALSSRQDWVPVDFGVADNDTVDFGYVGERTVCVAGIVLNGRFKPLSHPFKTDRQPDMDSIFFYVPGNEQTVNLYSKCTVKAGDFAARMIGGVFEASDTPDFTLTDTLHKIESLPKRLFNTVVVDKNKSEKRFIRYKGVDKTNCNVAEIAFYETFADTVPMHGKMLKAPGYNEADANHGYEKIWDGDPYTSFDLKEKSGGWAGLDLGRARRVGKIVFSPRNRGNFIRAGYAYELYYFDRENGWTSLGQKKADSDMLTMRAPKGALLYLHCLDGGVSERIFEYDADNDVQIFY